MARHHGNPGPLNVQRLAEQGSIKAMKPKPRKWDVALYVVAGLAFLGVWFLFGREVWRLGL